MIKLALINVHGGHSRCGSGGLWSPLARRKMTLHRPWMSDSWTPWSKEHWCREGRTMCGSRKRTERKLSYTSIKARRDLRNTQLATPLASPRELRAELKSLFDRMVLTCT